MAGKANIREYGKEYFDKTGMKKFLRDGERRGEHYAWRKVMRLVEPLPTDRVLDVGCGLGQNTYYLAQRCAEAVGIDPSQGAVDFAKEKFRADNLQYICGEVWKADQGGPFDQVCLLSVAEHMTQEQHNRALKAVTRLLVPGGALNVVVPTGGTAAARHKMKKRGHNTLDYTGDPTHVRSFTPDEIVSDIERFGFKLEAEEFDYARTLVSSNSLSRLARICPCFKPLLRNRALSAYLRFRLLPS